MAKNGTMANNIEHQDKGELVANCDRLQDNEVTVTAPIESRIMSIRGRQIMIDRDLAELYGVETKVLNQAVKRNMERFPERFRFQLTKKEMTELVTNCDRFNSLKHSTTRPYAFTEQGVAMLSTVLRSETAIRMSIHIMDAFVAMRRFMTTNAEIGVAAIIYTQQITRHFQLDIDRHNAQYAPIEINTFRLSHDRFLCIDDNVYHIGASIKDLGKKWFGFSKMEILTPTELEERINRG